MADDSNLAPWLKKGNEKPASEAAPDNNANLAPWLKKEQAAPATMTDYAVDAGKTALPSLARGSLMALTTPRAISDITGDVTNWAANKFGTQSMADSANKFHNWDTGIGGAFPSYDQLKGEMEHDVTGPLYEAKHGPGKAVQTGVEILPSMVAGGEGVLPAVGRSIGAGSLSGIMGSGLDWLHESFPKIIPDWAPKVGRAGGALVGGAVAPRLVTPLPMNNATMAERTALAARNPELRDASTAGQWTNSPRSMAIEARSPRVAAVPQAQAEAYTRGVMGQAGAPGQLFDAAGRAQAAGRGEELRQLQNAHNMNSTEFASLNRDLRAANTPGSELYRAVGPSQPYQNVVEQVRLGPAQGAATQGGASGIPLSMTGERYGALKQMMQSAGEVAPTTHEQTAIWNARQRMKDAFTNSMPPDEATRLRGLDTQYSNWKAIENINPKVGESVITPRQVHVKASAGSPLEEHANQAAHVMQPHPKPSNEPSEGVKAISTVVGAGLGGGASALAHGGLPNMVGEVGLGAIAGEKLPSFYNVGKNIVGRAAMLPPVQEWAKNQLWRPNTAYGTNSPNKEAILRALLASPTVRQLPAPEGSQ